MAGASIRPPGSLSAPPHGGWLAAVLAVACAIPCGCGSAALREGPMKDIRELVPLLEENRPKPLFAASWFPLVALHGRAFAEAGDAGDPTSLAAYPPGYVYRSMDAYGPVYMFHRARESRYDRAVILYEVAENRNVAWRIWTGRRTLVRAHHGWREEFRSEILFGIIPLGVRVTYLTGLPPEDAAESGVDRESDVPPTVDPGIHRGGGLGSPGVFPAPW